MNLLKKKKHTPTNKKDKRVSNPLFGIPLKEAAKKSDKLYGAVPSPLRNAIEWLNNYGLKEEGLYRVPGSRDMFEKYKYLFDHGENVTFEDEKSPENVAMMVIKYLQELPEPIYSSQYEQHFNLTMKIADMEERMAIINGILLEIPYENRETIKILVDHLKLVAENSEFNKMTSKNIGITWSLSVGQVTGSLFQLLIENSAKAPSTIVFNVPLNIAVENSYRFDTIGTLYVPNVVSMSVNWLIKHGAYKTEIFVEPGDPLFVEEYKQKFNRGEVNDFPDNAGFNNVASLLQKWIVDVTDGLIPQDLRNRFKRLPESPKKEHIKKLKSIFRRLPETNIATLKEILGLLCRIIAHSFLIDATVLSAIFGTSLRQPYKILIENGQSLLDYEIPSGKKIKTNVIKEDDIVSNNDNDSKNDMNHVESLHLTSNNTNEEKKKTSKRKVRKNKSDGETSDKIKRDESNGPSTKTKTKVKLNDIKESSSAPSTIRKKRRNKAQ